jgi:hypothetical protein
MFVNIVKLLQKMVIFIFMPIPKRIPNIIWVRRKNEKFTGFEIASSHHNYYCLQECLKSLNFR